MSFCLKRKKCGNKDQEIHGLKKGTVIQNIFTAVHPIEDEEMLSYS